ncbi:ABC-type transporter, periplasmic subunit [Leptolyngbya boryana NIES-2135]|jgi:peptide/nickel transport system substrate-binding protein|uniref:ABC-type transporter, periplasmic subunit n=1 Tax=Leptolyngbya boryana NIES-2135 TaxID=1973484 RepID=A0A1Z4JNF2_LEPBY|nr:MULTISPECIES: ABC transporter substrate-binding protein [Leptolyngbya]BAY58226.1 ABC-type transporter, periplasmic subunit [Leptolyngbya boryana NIES-2135]MBD2369209.1 ABC transporter substrate-binding protein [Leptolyngbya sp. FACHB-161]MBD2375444.1 ABC transporter substrate-binding protein [Leptolyngbya sp. FACHB-238]MBD2400018.1 ABC transporter substrate-binding protein [Leptolyngbya sp. FACHB-239]MBD2406378.1 ABC transporter substrate-binding protein [Leptolyngbya sp. FACHB-402]
MKKVRIQIGVCLTIALLFLSSCNPHRYRTVAAQVPQLVLASPTDPKTFNYANNQTFPSVFPFIYEGLTRENGLTGEYEPALAESWKFSPDNKRVVFTLRPNLKWSDGKPLTADDIVFTYRDIVFNPLIPTDQKESIQIGVKKVFPEIRKINDRQVEFILPEPFAPLIAATAAPEGIMILPKHALAEAINSKLPDGNPKFISTWGTDTDPKKIITNGAYVIDSYSPSQRLVLKRNPYYWRKDKDGKQLPYIDRIVWQFIENLDTQLLRFRSGDLDVMGDTRPLRSEYFSLLKREEKRGNFQVLNGGPWSGVLYLTFNLSKAKDKNGKPFVDPVKSRWFNTLEFRKAVAYAINRDRINTNLFRGLGVVQNSPISVQSPFTLKEGLKAYNYDPNQSKNLLKKAGFKYNDRGQLFDSDGNRVRFTLLTNSNNLTRVAIGAQIRQDLAAIGIQVDYNPLNFNVLIDKINGARDWDAHIIGFTGGTEPHGLANLWMTSGGSHSFNLSQQVGQPKIQGYVANEWEKEIDRLFIQGAQELNPEKRKKIYGEFQKLVQEQLPVIHLVNDSAIMAVRNRVQGLKYSGLPSWGLWNIQELKIKE